MEKGAPLWALKTPPTCHPIQEKPLSEPVGLPPARKRQLVQEISREPMPDVEGRRASLGLEVVRILRRVERRQVGRAV